MIPCADPILFTEQPDRKKTVSRNKSNRPGIRLYLSSNILLLHLESCTGEFEPLEESWWDVCGVIRVKDDDTGTIWLWDEDGARDNGMLAADVTFRSGTTPNGAMMSETGLFWDERLVIEHADFIVDPGASIVSDFDHMICIDGYCEDDRGSFNYYIFLRPWGMDWEDVREDDMLPASYDSWYVNVKDGAMPDTIGG